jgi:O-antigen ligase
MRQFIIFLGALIALSGSLSAVFATQSALDYDLRGYVDASQDPNLPYRLPRLGVNADLFQYNESSLRQQLDWMREAHVTWIRQFLYWDSIEVTESQMDWQTWDTIMAVMADYPDLRLVVVIMNSPQWARSSEIPTAPPDDPQSIRPILADFASRYGEAIDFYQIWDEPNLDDTWGLAEPRPTEYLALLAEAYIAIHSADADATVIAAALAPTTEREGLNIADTLYLEALYDLGAEAYFDAAAAKPHGFVASPEDRTVNINTLNFSRIIALREIMLAHGDGKTALWASNWGWNHLPADWLGSPSIWGAVSEEQQIAYTLAGLDRAEREWPWLAGMILQHWQPPVPENDPQWGFALIGADRQPKSLWQALVNRPEPEAATNGLYHPRTEFASYSGLWTFSALGADIGWLQTSDSQAHFHFYGTDIALLLREGDYIAFLYPKVDGETANATPHDANGNAYIFLRSASQEEEISIVPVSRHLLLAPHQLELIPDTGWDRWALAGYAVSSGNLAEPYQQQIQIAWLSALIAAIATLVSAYFLPWKTIQQKIEPLLASLNTVSQLMISVITSIALMLGMLLTWGTGETQIFRRELYEQTALIILTGGLLVLKPPFVIVILAGILLFILIYRRLESGLFLIILYAPFFLFPVELYRFAFPMSELLLLITAAAWFLRLLVQWGIERQSANPDYPLRLNIRWQSFDNLILLLALLGFLALFFSARQDAARTEFRSLFIEPLLFYAIVRSTKPPFTQLRDYSFALILSGVIVSMVSLIQFSRGEAIITAEDSVWRLAGVYGSPNNLGLFLGRSVPFALAFCLHAKDRLRYIMVVALLLMLITAGLTQSVGAILLGLPTGILSVILLTYRKKALLITLAFLAITIGATYFLAQNSARFANLLDLSQGTGFMRIRVWESSLEILQRHPFTGLGLDQFLYIFSGEYVRPDAIFDPDLSHPHNIFLDFWIRLGILGFFWILAFLFVFWRKAIRLWRRYENNEHRALLIGTMGAMAALLAHGLIDNSVFVQDLVYIFVLLTVFMASLSTE